MPVNDAFRPIQYEITVRLINKVGLEHGMRAILMLVMMLIIGGK